MNQEQKECPYCHAPFSEYRTGKGFFTGMVEGTNLEQREDGRWFAVAAAEDSEGWGCEVTVTRVKFCPWCGRKLTKKIEK